MLMFRYLAVFFGKLPASKLFMLLDSGPDILVPEVSVPEVSVPDILVLDILVPDISISASGSSLF